MTRVRFVSADGECVEEVEAPAGTTLLDTAWEADQPLEGTCGGQMACSTCHVIVAAEHFDRLPPASEEEDDLLDLAVGVTRRSRLACQIILTHDLDALTVHIPATARDRQR